MFPAKDPRSRYVNICIVMVDTN